MSNSDSLSKMKQIEDSVYEIPIELTKSLEAQRAIFQETIIKKTSIHQLVENAAKDDFVNWLKEISNTPSGHKTVGR